MVVGHAAHQPLADLMCNLLGDAEIPAFHRRALAFDVPDFLASGPRVVLVPRDRLDDARAVLDPYEWQEAPGEPPPNAR